MLPKRRGSAAKPAAETSAFDAWPMVACSLLLLSPLIILLTYHDYGYFSPEVLICVAALSVIGGLGGLAAMKGGRLTGSVIAAVFVILCIDLQFDWTWWWRILVWCAFVLVFLIAWFMRRNFWKVLSAIAATIFISTVFLPGEAEVRDVTTPDRGVKTSANRSIIVHLLLDGHIGAEGVPTDIEGGDDLKKMFRSFYRRHGFVLFGAAYSQYFHSNYAIAHALNLEVSPDETLVKDVRGVSLDAWKLRRNKYFERLADKGYRVHVYQSTYLDLCGGQRSAVARCHTYREDNLKLIKRANFPLADRIRVIAGFYLSRSRFYRKLKTAYSMFQTGSIGRALELPSWNWGRDRIVPMTAMAVIEQLKADITTASPGSVLFAHLLIPHDPYIYDARCRARRPRDWLGRVMFGDTIPMAADVRIRRYKGYIAQTMCAFSKLNEIFAVMERSEHFDRFVIVLHGDHGSRLSVFRPWIRYRARLSPSDYRDAFSTLFALRVPSGAPGYRTEVRSVQELLGTLVKNDFRIPPETEAAPGTPFVYITPGSGQLFPAERCPMTAFGESRSTSGRSARKPAAAPLHTQKTGAAPGIAASCRVIRRPGAASKAR